MSKCRPKGRGKGHAGEKPMSKYARKVASREEVKEPSPKPIESKVPETPQSFGTSAQPKAKMSKNARKKARRREEADAKGYSIVEARVKSSGKGFLFLAQAGGKDLYMGMNIVQKSPFNGQVRKGTVLKCETEPHPNGKGPRVRKILALLEP